MAVMIARILSALLGLAFHRAHAGVLFAHHVSIAVAAALLLGGWAWWRGHGRMVTTRRGR